MKPNIIFIEVRGPVQSGKSAVIASIKQLLENHDFTAVVMDRETKRNPPKNLAEARPHELPSRDNTLFCITESVYNV